MPCGTHLRYLQVWYGTPGPKASICAAPANRQKDGLMDAGCYVMWWALLTDKSAKLKNKSNLLACTRERPLLQVWCDHQCLMAKEKKVAMFAAWGAQWLARGRSKTNLLAPEKGQKVYKGKGIYDIDFIIPGTFWCRKWKFINNEKTYAL